MCSGAWACAAAKLVAGNLKSPALHDQFESGLRMWVREEDLPDGRKLTEVFNETHENVRYLPGIHLGDNVTAVTDLEVRRSHPSNDLSTTKFHENSYVNIKHR